MEIRPIRDAYEGAKERFVIPQKMGDEPIWARVGGTNHGPAAQPHGYGARMPPPDPQRDGEWRVVGWVTSGGYGHWVKKSLAQAYVPFALANREDEGFFQVEILGRHLPARIAIEPPFDPAGLRMRA